MWRALEKVRNLLLRILNKQFLIFLFFLILSSVFWLIMTLNETYEKEMTIPLRLADVPRKVVITDEPGIYFIPALIDEWRAKGLHKDFINYEKLETYKDFGGIRIEDDLLITKDGCRFLGKELIPYHPKDVEEYMSKN